MDLQKKRDELQAQIQVDTKEVHRLMDVIKRNIKNVKGLDKLIATYNDLTGEIDRVTQTLPE
jgi:hypothetical protein